MGTTGHFRQDDNLVCAWSLGTKHNNNTGSSFKQMVKFNVWFETNKQH